MTSSEPKDSDCARVGKGAGIASPRGQPALPTSPIDFPILS